MLPHPGARWAAASSSQLIVSSSTGSESPGSGSLAADLPLKGTHCHENTKADMREEGHRRLCSSATFPVLVKTVMISNFSQVLAWQLSRRLRAPAAGGGKPANPINLRQLECSANC